MTDVIIFIVITIFVWAFGCWIINDYEFFYDFADKFKYPINRLIKIIFNLPFIGLIIGILTLSIMLLGCLIGIIILFPIKSLSDAWKGIK